MMKNSCVVVASKYKLIIIVIIGFLFSFISCQSNSRSGRAQMITTVMSKKESNKKTTFPNPETIKKNTILDVIRIDKVVTQGENTKINNMLAKNRFPPVQGTLIQVEGLVLKEVSELTIKLNIPGPRQINQILTLRDYVRNKWHYLWDPDSGQETFRSAQATISLKVNGKYPGDCDDYAILMASFSRQLGLKSRVIGAFKNDGSGHAFAEFLVPVSDSSNSLLQGKDYRIDSQGKWISLDWFMGQNHRSYKNDLRIIAN